jgi:hypothetical protein
VTSKNIIRICEMMKVATLMRDFETVLGEDLGPRNVIDIKCALAYVPHP